MAPLSLRALFLFAFAILGLAVTASALDPRAEAIQTSGQCVVATNTDTSGRASAVPQAASCASSAAATPIGPLTKSINSSGSFTLLNGTSTAAGASGSASSGSGGNATSLSGSSSSSAPTSSSLATLSASSAGASTTVAGGSTASATSNGNGNGAGSITMGGGAMTAWALVAGLTSLVAGCTLLV